jgi:hypothetical protein
LSAFWPLPRRLNPSPVHSNLPFDQNAPESLTDALTERLESLSAQIDYEKSRERGLRTSNNQLTEERDALARSVTSLQSQLKLLEGTSSAASPLLLVPLARQLLDLARKSTGLPLPELQASLMNLASDALSKFDGSTAPPPAHQPPVAEAHPTPPPAPSFGLPPFGGVKMTATMSSQQRHSTREMWQKRSGQARKRKTRWKATASTCHPCESNISTRSLLQRNDRHDRAWTNW